MINIPTIFAAPEFIEALHAVFPDTLIYSFTRDVDSCRRQFAKLDLPGKKRAWLLYRSSDQQIKNAVVRDHINLSTKNPLIGPVDLNQGPRFPDMSNVYEHDDGEGLIVVLGKDKALKHFAEPWVAVDNGIWEAIALRQRGYNLAAWVITDLEKWVRDL